MKMKKTIVKLTSLFMAAAMVFTLSGCSGGKSEIEEALADYEQYNHFVGESNGEKINYYLVDESDSEGNRYDIVTTVYEEYTGYYIHIDGKYGCSVTEEYEQADSEGMKHFNYLDKYKVEKSGGDSYGHPLDNILVMNQEYELTEQDNKKIFTAKENDNYKSYVVTFEDAKITVETTDNEDYSQTTVYQFNNVDENYYENAAKEIQNLNGASRAQIKEKLGQFIEDNKQY